MGPTKMRFDPVYASVLKPEPYSDTFVPPATLPVRGLTEFIAASNSHYQNTRDKRIKLITDNMRRNGSVHICSR